MRVTKSQRSVCIAAGSLTVVGLGFVAVLWGRDGLELTSWLAGAGSLAVAMVTIFISLSQQSSEDRGSGARSGTVRNSARAKGQSVIFQAGGDITQPRNDDHR